MCTPLTPCSRPDSTDLIINFQDIKPEVGVSPGQVVGLWSEQGDWCLGSGLIAETTCLQ